MRAGKFGLFAAVCVASLWCRCEVLHQLAERLRVLQAEPAFVGVKIDPIYPAAVVDIVDQARSLGLVKRRVFEDPAAALEQLRGETGVAVTCSISLHNPNEGRAAFDGAAFFLHIDDPDRMRDSLATDVAAFAVEGDSTIILPVTFRLMMNNPLFSTELLQKVFYGESIPYNVSTILDLSLVDPLTEDTLDFTTQQLDLVTDSLPTRPDESTMELLADAATLALGG